MSNTPDLEYTLIPTANISKEEPVSSNDLLACPFCGSDAQFWEKPADDFDVRCSNAECYLCEGADWFVPKEEAVRMWNFRANGGAADNKEIGS